MARDHLQPRQIRCPLDTQNRDAIVAKLTDHDHGLDEWDEKKGVVNSLASLPAGALVGIGSDGLPTSGSVTNTQLALDSAKVGTLASGGWGDLQAQRMKDAGLNLRDIQAYPVIALPNLTPTGWADGTGVTGGSRVCVSGQLVTIVKGLVVNPSAEQWAVCARLQNGANNAWFGLRSGGSTWSLAWLDRASDTNYGVSSTVSGVVGAVRGAVAMDSDAHDIMLQHWPDYGLRLTVDGVLAVEYPGATVPNGPADLVVNYTGSSAPLPCLTHVAWGVQ